MIPAWIEAAQEARIPTGLHVDDALQRALELRDSLRGKTATPADFRLDGESVETLHALCTLLDQPGADPKLLLGDASAAFEFISTLDWLSDEFGGRHDLLSRLAFLCWRSGRRAEDATAEWKWFAVRSSLEGSNLNSIQSLLPEVLSDGSLLGDPSRLLGTCGRLRSSLEVSPATVLNQATSLYDLIKTSGAATDNLDQHDYYLGELALTAGTASRLLARRDESEGWLGYAESQFAVGHNAAAHRARVAYQRLALWLEERRFDEVSNLAPGWRLCFLELGLLEDALKCRFLEAQALKETERLGEAKKLFAEIIVEAERLPNERLVAIAQLDLVQIYAFLGDRDAALELARKAEPALRRLENRVNLAKLQLGVAYLLREQGERAEAVENFREAQRQFRALGMHADVAAQNLVLADLFLEAGQPARAELEIRAALPVIDELKLVPEGLAALSLLRDSLRLRQIDRQALRDLHGYFRNPKI